nr:PTS sugar transporter subunit IIA [Alkalibaculum sporogenes]
MLFCNLSASNFSEAIIKMGNIMEKKGKIRKSYIDAVIEREKTFPTGLEVGTFGIAIPHTDRQHVNISAVAIAKLDKPLKVYSMIEPQKKIDINLMFLMAIEDPDGQVKILQKLMSIIQDTSLLKKIEMTNTKDEMYTLIKSTGL